MATTEPSQWTSVKSIGDAFAHEDKDEHGFNEDQWGMIQEVIGGHRSIRSVKDSSEATFSPAQWSVLKDMARGRAEVQDTAKEHSKMLLSVSRDRIVDILIRERVFFSPSQWSVVKDMFNGSFSAQIIKQKPKAVFSSAQWAVISEAVGDKEI